MVGCSVMGCKNNTIRKIEGISFHTFLNDPEIRKLWITATNRLNWDPPRGSRIYSKHFNKEADVLINVGKKTFLFLCLSRAPSLFAFLLQKNLNEDLKYMINNKISPITRFLFERTKSLSYLTLKMAKSSYEYVKKFELDDTILPNTWIVIRLDGKCFHKFSEVHNFTKPNDIRALRLMNYAAFKVLHEFNDLLLAFGQSDEYSFIFKKDTNLYNRRASKLLTTINSKFSTSYVFYWNKFFEKESLKYPPTFDGRIVIYPSDENIIDYLKWRQADVHINNLFNTTFWALVQQGNLTPVLAEKRLCGTVSSDKNEILFKEFNINYNNELPIYKRGTLMLRKNVSNEDQKKYANVIVDVHDDMLKDNYWKEHSTLLLPNCKNSISHNGPFTDLIKEQIRAKNKLKNNMQNNK